MFLSNTPYYHGVTRNLVVAFCGLFSNLYLRNKDINGVSQKIVSIPIAFANKEKFIIRLQQDPGLNEDMQILLPRLSAEITGIDYDVSRQLNKTKKMVCTNAAGETVYMYAPAAYNLNFNLNSYTRTTEDNLQIMEQIIPFFRPDMNLSIKMMQDPVLTQDVPLILNSVTIDDEYDGSFEERRYIISTYSFTMKAYYYGPIIGLLDAENHFADSGLGGKVIKHVDININNSNKYTATVDPFEASESDIHSIIEQWSERIPEVGDPTL